MGLSKMINIILDTYLRKQKEVKKRSKFIVLLGIILFSITIASLFVISIKKDAILFYVLDFAAIIIFFIWCIFVQKREIQRSGERFTEYNKSLDLLNDILEKELTRTISTIDDILNNETITNAMLKTIIDVIEVDSEANIDVRLKLLNEIGIHPPTVLDSNVGT